MSKKERRDSDRWSDRRDSQPEDEQQRRSGEAEAQEGDSLTALKAILSKVATLLKPLQLTQEESIRLVEQLYGSVLDMDVKLAGEADDTRKASVLSHIQNTTIARTGDGIVVEFPTGDTPEDTAKEGTQPDGAGPGDRAPKGRGPKNKGSSDKGPAEVAERAPTADETASAAPDTPQPAEPGPSNPDAAVSDPEESQD